jgi:hypothetical protein
MTSHFISSADIRVALPPEAAIALFTPEGERSWAGKHGWDPRYPVPSRTSGAGAVFTTRHGEHTTTWVMVDQDPNRVRYARLTSHTVAGTVEVRVLAGTAEGTDLRVSYDLTALTDDARHELARFAAGYAAEIATWASDITKSLTAPRDNAAPSHS